MRLYLIRHAQSANNALTTYTDRVCDPDLTELGYRQAEALAGHLAYGVDHVPGSEPSQGYQITHLYCSAMYRALVTARPVSARLDLPPRVWVDTHELGGIYLDDDSGGTVGYPGRTRSQILHDFPHYVLPEEITETGWWRYDQRETGPAFRSRVVRVAEQLRNWADSDRSIVLISHGDFSNALLRVLLRQPWDNGSYHYHSNTGISRIDFRTDGYLVVRYLNRVPHLTAGLLS
ncbi:MAG: histidine phosphatase family protein [Chloroflexi bacterium]|nr:histidine phosphatase family protein [Chloroflexota bacterium]